MLIACFLSRFWMLPWLNLGRSLGPFGHILHTEDLSDRCRFLSRLGSPAWHFFGLLGSFSRGLHSISRSFIGELLQSFSRVSRNLSNHRNYFCRGILRRLSYLSSSLSCLLSRLCGQLGCILDSLSRNIRCILQTHLRSTHSTLFLFLLLLRVTLVRLCHPRLEQHYIIYCSFLGHLHHLKGWIRSHCPERLLDQLRKLPFQRCYR
mmetsp:Transcript_116623/g.212194  ORF Transcript_116623/g.212194 Transcript_116623/m.212194 type:complete len:206 (+) Transcript_116623:755-1372(+)